MQPLSSRPGRGQSQRQTKDTGGRGPDGGTSPNAESSQPRSQGHDMGKFGPLPPFSEAGRGGGCGVEVGKASGPGCRGEGPRSTFPHSRPTRDTPSLLQGGRAPQRRGFCPLSPWGVMETSRPSAHSAPLCRLLLQHRHAPLCPSGDPPGCVGGGCSPEGSGTNASEQEAGEPGWVLSRRCASDLCSGATACSGRLPCVTEMPSLHRKAGAPRPTLFSSCWMFSLFPIF